MSIEVTVLMDSKGWKSLEPKTVKYKTDLFCMVQEAYSILSFHLIGTGDLFYTLIPFFAKL